VRSNRLKGHWIKLENSKVQGRARFSKCCFLKETVVAHLWTFGSVATATLASGSPAWDGWVRKDDDCR